MGFWGDVGDFFGNVGEGLVGGGDGVGGMIGKGLGFLTPLGAVTGVGSIGNAMGGMTKDANAFGGAGGSGMPGGGIPGLSGLLGGAAGGGAGAPGGQQQWQPGATPDAMKIQLGQAAQMQGVTGPAADAQNALLKQLQDQANGIGPSLAQQQLQAGTEQNLRQQAALSAGGRNPGLASYQAGQNQSAAGQQMAGQAAQARLIERQQAQQGLAGLAGQMGQQQLGMQQFNAGAQNQFGLAQGNLNQQQNELFNKLNAGQSGAYNDFLYKQALQQMQNDEETKKALIGGTLGAAGSAAQMYATKSDARAKRDVRDGSELVQAMLDHLGAHDYEYRNPAEPGAAEGRHVSVMAQELEQSELGRRLVRDTPHGKVVDYARGFAVLLATVAQLNARIRQLEAAKES